MDDFPVLLETSKKDAAAGGFRNPITMFVVFK